MVQVRYRFSAYPVGEPAQGQTLYYHGQYHNEVAARQDSAIATDMPPRRPAQVRRARFPNDALRSSSSNPGMVTMIIRATRIIAIDNNPGSQYFSIKGSKTDAPDHPQSARIFKVGKQEEGLGAADIETLIEVSSSSTKSRWKKAQLKRDCS